MNWGGTATDPELGYIFVNSKDEPMTGWIAPNPRYNEKTKDTEYIERGRARTRRVARCVVRD